MTRYDLLQGDMNDVEQYLNLTEVQLNLTEFIFCRPFTRIGNNYLLLVDSWSHISFIIHTLGSVPLITK